MNLINWSTLVFGFGTSETGVIGRSIFITHVEVKLAVTSSSNKVYQIDWYLMKKTRDN